MKELAFSFLIMSVNNNPIGIIDSGLGGLTVAKAINMALPAEGIIYFGDTMHQPYGDKSKETIIQYSKRIASFLVKQKCKTIVIACNSVSANALDDIVKTVGNNIEVINVIDSAINYVTSSNYKSIGIIGTKSTIDSNVYDEKFKSNNRALMVSTVATPLLAPMIEEGFVFDEVSNAIIRHYLSRYDLRDIEALILGCTHYPVVKNQINKYYNFDVDIIESGKIVAEELRKILTEGNLLNNLPDKKLNKFYVSDITSYSKIIAKMFYEEEVALEVIKSS